MATPFKGQKGDRGPRGDRGFRGATGAAGSLGGGDVTGPASAVDDRIAVFDGITGKLLKDGGKLLTDKVDSNGAITGATKTKVTYDVKGLVTAGADATTADVADSSNKRYVTDADLVDIGNLSGVNTGDQSLTAYFNKSVDDTDDITEGTNKFATAAEKTKLSNISITQAVDLDAIETRVNELDASVVLKGVWDASAGTFPGSGVAQAGWSYIVSVAGTVDGVAFVLNDRIISITDNASTTVFAANWFKADYTDQVISVNSLTGAVTLTTANVADSLDKRYVTDANLTTIGNQSGTNTGDNTNFAPPLGADDNYVTDAEKIVIGNTSGTNTGDNATNTQYSGLAASKQDTLVSGTNIKTVNGSSLLGAGNVAVSASITQTEVDFGTTPLAQQTFNIADAAAIVGSKIIASLAYDAPTGKDLDELEMDDLVIKCGNATTGFFDMLIKAVDGSYLADKFKVNYVIA